MGIVHASMPHRKLIVTKTQPALSANTYSHSLNLCPVSERIPLVLPLRWTVSESISTFTKLPTYLNIAPGLFQLRQYMNHYFVSFD